MSNFSFPNVLNIFYNTTNTYELNSSKICLPTIGQKTYTFRVFVHVLTRDVCGFVIKNKME